MEKVVAVIATVVLVMVVVIEGQSGQSCSTEAGLVGICGPIRDCPELRNLLLLVRGGNAPPDSLQRLRKAICSFNNNQPLVCCTAQTSQPQPPPLPPQPQPRPPQLQPNPRPSTHEDLLPTNCGISALVDRIIDGEDAPLLAWPWMALLRGRVSGRGSSFYCGGVLINNRYVLTAAHCLKQTIGIQLEFVRIGEHTISKSPDCEKGRCAPPPQDIQVSEVIRHPQYGNPCRECNDIALLRLATPATLNPLHVVPICLPVNPARDLGFSEQEYQGQYAWAAGWGSTARNPTVTANPDKLQQVLLRVQTLQYCEQLKRSYPETRMAFCAGGERKDTCRGDSGGPLVLSNTVDTKKFVVGITSLGPRVCGTANTQGLYTNVHYYVPWILANLRP
ncbi:hypothetical protein Pcinc_025138 [Petrolisthes cinctipes]|uniref:CLIP domain-containing serine protease n=1 Tax=Petrolisthes cinctipes TaxID=88211 RepID=A0AAE1F9R7_PETCI|nr:hypothetical protein Pcinc_025138 [Petrolisthes cinctipes]